MGLKLNLKDFKKMGTCGEIKIRKGRLVCITPSQKYSYAAGIDLTSLGIKGTVRIRISAKIRDFDISFGVLAKGSQGFLVEKGVAPGHMVQKVVLDIYRFENGQELILRPRSDGAAVVEVLSIDIEKRETLSFAQRYGVGGVVHEPITREIHLAQRRIVFDWDSDIPPAGLGESYTHQHLTLNLAQTALFIIDSWAYHHDVEFSKRSQDHICDHLVPLLELARRHRLFTVFLPHAHPLSPAAFPSPGEVVIFGGDDYSDYEQTYYQQLMDLLAILAKRNIRQIIYAGYATNRCLLHRPAGLIRMAHRGYNCMIIRDCTLAMETRESIDGQWLKWASIAMIEDQFGGSTTLLDLEIALLPLTLVP